MHTAPLRTVSRHSLLTGESQGDLSRRLEHKRLQFTRSLHCQPGIWSNDTQTRGYTTSRVKNRRAERSGCRNVLLVRYNEPGLPNPPEVTLQHLGVCHGIRRIFLQPTSLDISVPLLGRALGEQNLRARAPVEWNPLAAARPDPQRLRALDHINQNSIVSTDDQKLNRPRAGAHVAFAAW
jgi:hypothetical protein